MKNLKKKPIQIYIESRQDSVLTTLARKKGTSKAAIIRESLDRYLREIPFEEDPALGLSGLGSSGRKNLSEQHDKYLTGYIRRKRR